MAQNIFRLVLTDEAQNFIDSSCDEKIREEKKKRFFNIISEAEI